jgi:hypothetical protein
MSYLLSSGLVCQPFFFLAVLVFDFILARQVLYHLSHSASPCLSISAF